MAYQNASNVLNNLAPLAPVQEPVVSPNAAQAVQMRQFLKDATYQQAVQFYQMLFRLPELDNWLLANLAENDRFFLLTHILRRPDALHPWLYERCREVEANPFGFLDLWAREHYKSTFITFAGTIQMLLNDPETTIGIFSCTRPIAKAFLSQIKTEFESNPTMHQLWPNIVWGPDEKPPVWGLDTGIVLKRRGNPKEQSVEAWGVVDGQPTSKHFKILLFDDLVTLESVGTAEMIEKTTERLEVAFNLGTRKELGGQTIFAGTRYKYGDTYQTLKERGVFVVREYPATDDGTFDGKPVFLTEEEWEDKKRGSSKFTIACQQLLNPIAGSEMTFDPAHLRMYEVRPAVMNVYILCDPASSRKKGSDRTAIAVIGVDHNLNKYLLDGICHRMKLPDRWKTIRDLRRKWVRQPGVRLVKVGYEKYGLQSDIEHFQEMMKLTKEYFQIEELSWTRDGQQSKNDRVQRLQADFENWMFFIPYSYKTAQIVCELNSIDPPDERAAGQLTQQQDEVVQRGKSYMVAKPIRKVNEEGRMYDLTNWMILNEYILFPSIHPDILDAMSRIYDIEPAAPSKFKETDFEPAIEPDY